MKFAAIDIGSNAVRLLFSNVSHENGDTRFKKSSLIRVPLRLGEDAFIQGRISKEKADKLISTLTAFRLLIEVTGVSGYRACATSAMREASNSRALIKRIEKEAGIRAEVIDGREEADIICSNHIAETLASGADYVYIDVGGGSTELSVISGGKITASQSFNVGTIRILHEKVKRDDWEAMKYWIKEKTSGRREIIAIGSGGNINKLYKMGGQKQGKPMSIEKIKELTVMLSRISYDERITSLGLNPDRADVIIPAGKIFHTIMKSGGIRKIIVPQIGLADGIVHRLYEAWLGGKQS